MGQTSHTNGSTDYEPTDGPGDVAYRRSQGGATTKIHIGAVPNSNGRYFVWVEQGDLTRELGTFASEDAADEAAHQWMSDHPSGIGSVNRGMGFALGGF